MLLKDGDFLCLDDIIVKIKELLTPERKMINEDIMVCKLILVDPATSAAGERSFSTARRLKTWLCLTMTQEPGAPNDGFLPNALKRCFRLSGVLLKLCRLILGCAINFYLFGHSRGTVVFPNLLGLFVYFPKTLGMLGLIAFSKILADLFLCPNVIIIPKTKGIN